MADVQIGCPCPGHPHDSDTVTLRDTLGFREAGAIKYAVRIFKNDQPDTDAGQMLQFLSEQYMRHGISGWSLRDEKGKALPVTWPNIEQVLFADPLSAEAVADAADGLYSQAVLLPLLLRAATSSQPGPTNGSTSATNGSRRSKEPQKRSKRSSISTTPTDDTEPMSASPAGVSRS